MTTSVRSLSLASLVERQEQRAERFLPMQASVYHQNAAGQKRHLLTVGGIWDRVDKLYVCGPDGHVKFSDSERSIIVTDAQLDATEWFCDWLQRYIQDDWADVDRAYTALLFGARGGGKTWLACAALALVAIGVPGAKIWAASPTEDKTEELRRELGCEQPSSLLPRPWYRYHSDKLEFRLANGSTITQRSGHLRLREGRADFVLLNEAQLMRERVYRDVRGAITKRAGGLVMGAANPPDDLKGQWVANLVRDSEENDSQRRAVCFHLDPRKNPYSSRDAIESMVHDMSEEDYRRDVLGLLTPIGKMVFSAFDERKNIRGDDDFAGMRDITPEITRRMLGASYRRIVAWDFDKTPWIVAIGVRCFASPDAPNQFVVRIEHELLAEDQDEGDAIKLALSLRQDCPVMTSSGIEHAGSLIFDTKTTICIGDASGDWQGTKRIPGRTSFQYFSRAGWRIVPPSPMQRSNPPTKQTIRCVNAALCNQAGERRLFIHPRCSHTIEALREWPRRDDGEPQWKHQHAHLSAAVRYLCYRLFWQHNQSSSDGGDYKPIRRSASPRSAYPDPRYRGRARRG